MSFIFQSRPIRYNLRKELVPGRQVAWVASRYRDFMQPGEVVYFWLSGEPDIRGIYGWGEITAEHPELDPNGIYRVRVTYRRNFLDHDLKQHLSVDEIKADEVLAAMLILRLPMGTNFYLSQEENAALFDLIRKKYGEGWLPPEREGTNR